MAVTPLAAPERKLFTHASLEDPTRHWKKRQRAFLEELAAA